MARWSTAELGKALLMTATQQGYVEWLAVDIETAGGRPEDAEAWMRQQWEPSKAWKPETIGNRYLEMLGKKVERLALLDASQIIVVTVRTPLETVAVHCMKASAIEQVEGAFVQGYATEAEMLVALRGFMMARADDSTVICGHNIVSFDLPRLRGAFLRNGIQLPSQLARPDLPLFDSMREFTRRFSADTEQGAMISLNDLLERIGMASHKKLIDGADVPKLYQDGQHDVLIRYALLDVVTESEVFLRMTGRSQAMK